MPGERQFSAISHVSVLNVPCVVSSMLIMLREGFEAALVVSIVLVYLRRIDRPDLRRSVWLGVAAAVGASVVVGLVVRATIGDLEGATRLRAFAAVSAVALVVLTWMVFWMRRQARQVRGELEAKIDAALRSERTGRAVALVAMAAVVREGIESALFLLALSDRDGAAELATGALLGLSAAVALAALIYWGGRRIPMRVFFAATGAVLVVFAAGLTAHTIQLLQATGDLPSSNLNGVYDLRSQAWLTERTQSGRFLAALVGWDPRPSIEQLVAWLGYAVPVLVLYLTPNISGRRPRPQPAGSTNSPSSAFAAGESPERA